MSNYSNDIEERKERKDKNKVRKEKLAGFFFNLAQLTYTALVLGSVVLFFQGNNLSFKLFAMLIIGGIVAYLWAKVGNNLLK